MKETTAQKLRFWGMFSGIVSLYVVLLAVIYQVNWNDIYIFSDRPVVVEKSPVKIKNIDKKEPAKVIKSKAIKSLLEEINKEQAKAIKLHNSLKKRFAELKNDNSQNYTEIKNFVESTKNHSPAHLRMIIPQIEQNIAKIEKIQHQKKETISLATMIKNETENALSLHRTLRESFANLDKRKTETNFPKEYAELKHFIDLIRNYSEAHLRMITPKLEENIVKIEKIGGKIIDQQKAPAKPKEVQKKPERSYTAEQLELIDKISKTNTIQKVAPNSETPKRLINQCRLHAATLEATALYESNNFATAFRKLEFYIKKLETHKLSPIYRKELNSIKEKAEMLRLEASEKAHNLIGLTVVKEPIKLPEKISEEYQNIAEKHKKLAKQSGYPLEVKNRYGMHFRFIPAGTYLMGSPDDEDGRDRDEKLHKVTISRPFYMQITEMSKNQFSKIVPTEEKPDDSIVSSKVSWKSATKFCQQLNIDENLPADLYALPTEAQWEYACRATTTTPTYLPNRDEIAFSGDSFTGEVKKSAQKTPNAWGLYDMLGNVREVCLDRCESSLFFSKVPKTYKDGIIDPVETKGNSAVVRGGGWGSSDSNTRAASRELIHPEDKLWDVGFRIIRLLPKL